MKKGKDELDGMKSARISLNKKGRKRLELLSEKWVWKFVDSLKIIDNFDLNGNVKGWKGNWMEYKHIKFNAINQTTHA